ncbi:retrotransposon-like protein 1 [Conglomerata obtusa]
MGCVERANQTIFNKIKKLSDFGRLDWKRHVQQATEGYNMSFHRAIDTCPYMMKYGKLPQLKIDNKLDIEEITSSLDYLHNKRNEKYDAYSKTNIQKGNKGDNRIFKIGDKVLIYSDKQNKIEAKWVEGYNIVKQENGQAFWVTNGVKSYRLNKEMLKADTRIFSNEGVSLYNNKL